MKLLKIGLPLLLIISIIGYWGFSKLNANNINSDKKVEVLIPSKSSYDDVIQILKKDNVIKDWMIFDKVAQLMKYDVKKNVPSGKYVFTPGMNTRAIITKLRSGDQSPVNLTFNNARTLQDLAGDLSKNIELDSITILDYITDSKVQKDYGLTKETMMTLFIPNTYQVWWNTSKEKLIKRLASEQKKFWTPERIALAKKQSLTPTQAYTLASIVQKESGNAKEQPTIAGLYLNRLKRGIKLQADPTVVFANQDFTIRRVLNKHLEKDSPYNTYKYTGLPPGPIGMSSINAINAVLKPHKHNYLYMCAKPGYQSLHAFAKTHAEHNRNATIYRNWLNKEKIMK